jgi:transposase
MTKAVRPVKIVVDKLAILERRTAMIHIGLDLHHRNSYIRAITDDETLFPGRRIYHSNMMELWQYLQPFGDQPKRVVFEATSNARWMMQLLRQDPTIEPVAVTPHKVRIIAETVAKTDKIDATVLAQLSRMNALPRAWLPDGRVEELRELIRHRSALVQRRTQAKNRVNGALVRDGRIRPLANIFGPRGRRWLEAIDLPDVMRFQVEQWLENLDRYEVQLKQVEDRMRALLKKYSDWQAQVELLRTMPGVGLLTALTILGELGDFQRFRTRGSVSAFAGLTPTSKRSDRSCRYGKISKRGSTELRRILVEVSINAIRRVPRYAALYERLKRAKSGNVGKVAVARQMLEDCWTMLMKHEPFRLVPVQAESLTRAG